jgi:hypothetical protein
LGIDEPIAAPNRFLVIGPGFLNRSVTVIISALIHGLKIGRDLRADLKKIRH